MFHSTPASEPVAHFLGLICGLLGYWLTALFTHDHSARLWVGGVASVLCNVVIGAKINLVMLDVLALIVVRPLSAIAGLKLLAIAANTMGG